MKNKFKPEAKTVQLTAIAISLFIIMALLRPRFLGAANINSMLLQLAITGPFAMCIAAAYLSRGIDLSIVSIANLVGIVSGIIFRTRLTPDSSQGQIVLTILLCVFMSMLIGLACGLLNGILIAELGIFPILVTMGTQNVFMGIAMILTQGRAETSFPSLFVSLGDVGVLAFGGFMGIPLVTVIFILIYVLFCVIVHKTPYGLKLQWYGSNSKVSFFSGINNKKVVYTTYLLSGFIASVAGIIIMVRTGSAKADYGTTYVFQALLTCVLAGISPMGGRGKAYNLILSLLALQFLSTGFNMLRISPLIRDSLYGFLLVIAIFIEYIQSKRQNERLNRNAIRSAGSAAS